MTGLTGRICGALIVIGLLSVPWSPDLLAGEAAIVNCYDPSRDLVEKKLRDDCRGRAVGDAEAAEIRERRIRRILPSFDGGSGPARIGVPGAVRSSFGTGVFVSRDGLVVTNNHVVVDCSTIVIETTGGDIAAGRMIAKDERFDLALLRAGLAAPAEAQFRERIPSGGESLALVGYPTRILPPLKPVLTSATFLRAHGEPATALTIRAEVRPGNSGGPLLNAAGDVVGIIVAQINTPKVYRETGVLAEHIGVAIPNRAVLQFLRRSGVQYVVSDASGPLAEDQLFERGRAFLARITCRK